MLIGASTRSFGGMSVQKVAEIFSESGLSCAELCFCQSELSGWKYNLCGYEPLPCAEGVLNAVEVFRSYGINVSALGVYNCFWSGTVSEISDSFRLFSEYCALAESCNIKMLATHGGALTARPFSRDSGYFYRKLCDGFVYACIEAEKRGLTVAVEYGPGDAIENSGDYYDLVRYVKGSLGRANMLKCIRTPVLDAEGLSDSDISLFHIKDRKTDGRYYERFGDGNCDFSAFFDTAEKNPDIPLIFEYINAQNIQRTVREFKNAMNIFCKK
ncbi:MAG: sugar phosphate isomerase/epimerase [Clostridia bacterium]|nr:sugar phosphate isomerase/epimerase [Clostridia bacterium]